MSDQYLKIKGKKLRRRTTSTGEKEVNTSSKTKGELAFDRLKKLGSKLDSKLSDDKYLALLNRTLRHKVSSSVLARIAAIPDAELVIGKLDRVLKGSYHIKSLITLGPTSLPNQSFPELTCIAHRVGASLKLITVTGRSFVYDPEQKIYTKIISQVELPPDLRNWNIDWATAFTRASLGLNANTHKNNIKNSKRVYSGEIKYLDTLRRINTSLSKKQKLKLKTKKHNKYDAEKLVFEMPDLAAIG